MIPEELVELSADLKRISHELWEIKRDLAWSRVIDDAIRVCRALGQWEAAEARKYREDQPRVPAGNQDGGQWTDAGSGTGNTGAAGSDEGRVISDANPDNFWKPGAQLAQAPIGHNNPPPDDPQPPEIPKDEPASRGEKISLARAVATWMAATGSVLVLEGWALSELWPSIRSSLDAPKAFKELQRSHQPSEKGYHDHHIAEQTPAEKDGFSRSKINGTDNVVRIPEFKHYEISRWYSTKNSEFGYKSPRDYLRGKSWQERIQVGEQALKKFKVLKP